MSTNTYLANRYFDILKPLDDKTKLQIVTLLVNSIKTKEDKGEKTPRAKSLFDLCGVWNNSEGKEIERTIRESRNEPHTRNIVAFE